MKNDMCNICTEDNIYTTNHQSKELKYNFISKIKETLYQSLSHEKLDIFKNKNEENQILKLIDDVRYLKK